MNSITDKSVSDRIREYVARCETKDYMPTVREICKGVGISSTSHVLYWIKKCFGEGYKSRKFPVPNLGNKYCTTCRQEKPLDRFPVDKNHADARASNCFDCRSKMMIENIKNDPLAKKKYLARKSFRMAVSKGLIEKPDACQLCGKAERLEGHHWKGYEDKYVFDVQWLCKACHVKEDKAMRKANSVLTGPLVSRNLTTEKEK